MLLTKWTSFCLFTKIIIFIMIKFFSRGVQNLLTLLNILTLIFACFNFISEKKMDENKKGFRTL